MATRFANLKSKIGNLKSDERGQALIFGALTLFMLAAFIIFIADLGIVTSTRIQVQNAADECAYAGAVYEANVVSSVAYLNEAMAYMYYDALRYAMDTTVTGVLASLKRYGPPYPGDRLVYNDYDGDPSAYSGSPVAHYDRAFDRARQNVPQIERTLAMFARWEWGMALSCAELVKMEINRTALKHDIDAIAIYPDVDFFPGNGVQFDLHILKLMDGGQHVGWRVWSDDPPFYVEARRLGQFHWLITNTNHDTYEIQRIADDTYRVQTPSDDITVQQVSDTHVKLDLIKHDDGKTTSTHIDARYLEGLGWAVAMSNAEYTIEYVPFRDGGYTIKVTDKDSGQTSTTGVRRDPQTGNIQEWSGSGWQDVPGQRDSVSVGGVDIPVQMDNRIHLGPDTWFRTPNELHLPGITYHIPNVFRMNDVWVSLRDDTARIDAFVTIPVPGGRRRLRFSVDESDLERMNIYGLLGRSYYVPGSANCMWYTNRTGDERDRLCRDCQLLEGECDGPESEETEFTYQYRLGKPYFIKEDLRRFAHHAICDRDPYARANNFEYPQWTEWYDIAQGEPRGREYYQTRPQWGAVPNYDSDGDGENDSVRVYASDTWGLNTDATREFDEHYQKVKPWNLADLGVATATFAPPVRLSEDFFFYGLTVGCWKDTRSTRTTPLALFKNPDWGTVAAASARCGFLEMESDDASDPVPHYRFTWPEADQVEQFVNAGYENLYEPVWTAHLWPMTDAIRSEHIRAYVDNQTGVSYLFDGLLHTYWYIPRSPDQLGEEPQRLDYVPWILGYRLNANQGRLHLRADDPRIEDVLLH